MSISKNSYYTELRKDYPRTWRIWFRMNQRVKLKQHGYTDVGICDDWNIYLSSEQGFLTFFDDMGPSESDLQIDRINPFGEYEKSNCRWVTRVVQNNNTRKHFSGQHDNLTKAKSNGIKRDTYYQRIKRGWNEDDAATLPVSNIPYRNRLV